MSTVKTVRRQDPARTLSGLCQDSVRTLSGLCQDCQDRCGRSTNQVTNSVISTALRSSTRQLDPAPMIARGLNVRRAKQMPAMLHRLMSVNADARRA